MDNPIGAVSVHLKGHSAGQIVECAVGHGLSAIEWFDGERLAWTEPSAAADAAQCARQRGLTSSYHAPWEGRWNLAAGTAAQAAQALRELLERACRLDARLMTVHLGRRPAEDHRHDALERIAAALNEVAPAAAKLDVVISIENFTRCYHPDDLGDRLSDMEYVLSAVDSPAVGFNLDVGHAHITGNLAELVRKLGPRLRNTHLHDTDGLHDHHRPPGGGTIDFPALLAMLSAAGYRGPFNFEFPDDGQAYRKLIELIRST